MSAAPNLSRLRIPAQLQASVDTVTPSGGRGQAWTPVATLFVELTVDMGREAHEADAAPARRDMASAVARDHPQAQRGQQLVIGADPPWRVLGVERPVPAPGFMTLRLDRYV